MTPAVSIFSATCAKFVLELVGELAQPLRAAEPALVTRATIAWSHDLLNPGEQELFARLAVFTGGWTLEAAERVCDADPETLGSLVDKSLIRRHEGRFQILETIREYAAERLDDDATCVAARGVVSGIGREGRA